MLPATLYLAGIDQARGEATALKLVHKTLPAQHHHSNTHSVYSSTPASGRARHRRARAAGHRGRDLYTYRIQNVHFGTYE